MRPYRVAVLAAAAGLLVPSVGLACLWDYDTIKMERARFPGTLELITGKFLRHSPEFYQWRITNRLTRLEADPSSAALLDDLAAAYDKTGQHEKAIETAQKTERLHPGRYETAANLATFYFHAGKLEEGLPYIDRALTINPNAHFGREKYQKLLAEYTLYQFKGGPVTLPMAESDLSEGVTANARGHEIVPSFTFADFLQKGSGKQLERDEVEAAVKGVAGMMKFGKHDSPVLLEALGALLVHRRHDNQHDAKLLAARAFLKASYEVPEGRARASYRQMATGALSMQTPGPNVSGQIGLEQVEFGFQRELEEARAWYADLRARELAWIRDGQDPEAEFDKLYESEPELSGLDGRSRWLRIALIGLVIAVGIVVAGLLGAALVVQRGRRTPSRAP
jgi:tetratricopeptide (TPR) repeat protein